LFPFSSKQQKIQIKIKIKIKLISQSYSSRLKVPVVLRPTIARSDVVIVHALFPSSIAVKGYILPGLLSVVSKNISIKKTGQTYRAASSKTNKAG
jgi:hypothetical protein